MAGANKTKRWELVRHDFEDDSALDGHVEFALGVFPEAGDAVGTGVEERPFRLFSDLPVG